MKSVNVGYLKKFQQEFQAGQLASMADSLPNDYLNEKNLLTKKTIQSIVQKINSCTEKVFKEKSALVNKTTGEIIGERVNFLHGNYCNQFLLCPVCARKRSDTIKAKYGKRIKDLSRKYKHKYMMTFTIENSDNFSESWDLLQTSLRNFRRNSQTRRRFSKKLNNFVNTQYREGAKIKAGLGCGEVKIGKNSNKWHLHFHFIIFTDEMLDYKIYDEDKKRKIIDDIKLKYGRMPNKLELKSAILDLRLINSRWVPVSKLSKEWYKATNTKGINIDCRPIDDCSPEILNEIIKYASKLNEIPVKMQLDILINKTGKRFLVTWGEMRGIEPQKDIFENIEDEENMLKYNYIESYVYSYKDQKIKSMPNDEEVLIGKLLEKKDQIKEFRILSNKVLAYRNQIFDAIKKEIFIKSLNNPLYKRKKIIEINSIRKAFKFYIDNLFFNMVRIDKLKCKSSKVKALTIIEKQYYERFQDYLEGLPDK